MKDKIAAAVQRLQVLVQRWALCGICLQDSTHVRPLSKTCVLSRQDADMRKSAAAITRARAEARAQAAARADSAVTEFHVLLSKYRKEDATRDATAALQAHKHAGGQVQGEQGSQSLTSAQTKGPKDFTNQTLQKGSVRIASQTAGGQGVLKRADMAAAVDRAAETRAASRLAREIVSSASAAQATARSASMHTHPSLATRPAHRSQSQLLRPSVRQQAPGTQRHDLLVQAASASAAQKHAVAHTTAERRQHVETGRANSMLNDLDSFLGPSFLGHIKQNDMQAFNSIMHAAVAEAKKDQQKTAQGSKSLLQPVSASTAPAPDVHVNPAATGEESAASGEEARARKPGAAAEGGVAAETHASGNTAESLMTPPTSSPPTRSPVNALGKPGAVVEGAASAEVHAFGNSTANMAKYTHVAGAGAPSSESGKSTVASWVAARVAKYAAAHAAGQASTKVTADNEAHASGHTAKSAKVVGAVAAPRMPSGSPAVGAHEGSRIVSQALPKAADDNTHGHHAASVARAHTASAKELKDELNNALADALSLARKAAGRVSPAHGTHAAHAVAARPLPVASASSPSPATVVSASSASEGGRDVNKLLRFDDEVR